MRKKTRGAILGLMLALLFSMAVPACAFCDMAADRPMWAIGREIRMRFRMIGENQTLDNLVRNIYRKSWEENLLYERDAQIKPVTPDQAEVIGIDRENREITVIFHQPGRYAVGGERVYILDPENETLAAVDAELRDAVEKCRGRNEKETASRILEWMAGRIRYGGDSTDYPERGGYEDPIGILTGGEAICTGYARLYAILTDLCGIKTRTLTVSVRDGGHVICLNRLDGEWNFTDPTWCDAGKTSNTKYFAMSEEKMRKTFTFPDYDGFYAEWFGSPERINALNGILDI